MDALNNLGVSDDHNNANSNAATSPTSPNNNNNGNGSGYTYHHPSYNNARRISMAAITMGMIIAALIIMCIVLFDSALLSTAAAKDTSSSSAQLPSITYDNNDNDHDTIIGDEDEQLTDVTVHPLVLPSCANWFAGGPIDICITRAHGHPTPSEIEVQMRIHGRLAWHAVMNHEHGIHALNISMGDIQVTGEWYFRDADEYGGVGQGLWADMYYNEGTPKRHHYKGELISLDTRPSPSSHGRWWGIYHLTWRREHSDHHERALSLHSYRGNMPTGKLQLGGALSNSIDFEFIWGDDGMYARGNYRLDQQRRQLIGRLRLCPSKQCRTFSGVITSW